MTHEDLSKTFWNNITDFSSRWVWNLREVPSGISFFHVATAIATTVYYKNLTKNKCIFSTVGFCTNWLQANISTLEDI